jgi:hypothetical protein
MGDDKTNDDAPPQLALTRNAAANNNMLHDLLTNDGRARVATITTANRRLRTQTNHALHALEALIVQQQLPRDSPERALLVHFRRVKVRLVVVRRAVQHSLCTPLTRSCLGGN